MFSQFAHHILISTGRNLDNFHLKIFGKILFLAAGTIIIGLFKKTLRKVGSGSAQRGTDPQHWLSSEKIN